jgi:hypothetical protein
VANERDVVKPKADSIQEEVRPILQKGLCTAEDLRRMSSRVRSSAESGMFDQARDQLAARGEILEKMVRVETELDGLLANPRVLERVQEDSELCEMIVKMRRTVAAVMETDRISRDLIQEAYDAAGNRLQQIHTVRKLRKSAYRGDARCGVQASYTA